MFLAQVAVAQGDLPLAARCWKKAIEVYPAGWAEVADRAGAVLSPEMVLSDLLPPGGQYPLEFADRLYRGPESREARELFLREAIARARAGGDVGASEAERLWTEARARARLGEQAAARRGMDEVMAMEPLDNDRRAEYIDWLIEWGSLSEAHRVSLVGLRLEPDHPGLRRAYQAVVDALARPAEGPKGPTGPAGASPAPG